MPWPCRWKGNCEMRSREQAADPCCCACGHGPPHGVPEAVRRHPRNQSPCHPTPGCYLGLPSVRFPQSVMKMNELQYLVEIEPSPLVWNRGLACGGNWWRLVAKPEADTPAGEEVADL